MGVYIPAGYAQVAFRCALSGRAERMVTTLAVTKTVLPVPNTVAHDLYDLISDPAHQRPYNAGSMTNVHSLEGATATIGPSTAPLVGVWNQTRTGTGTGAPPPPNVTYLVRKNTLTGGRKGRGRTFMPAFIPEASIDHLGVVGAGALTSMQLDWDNFFTALTAAGYTPVLLHSNPADTPSAIVSFSVQSLVATQRRRLR